METLLNGGKLFKIPPGYNLNSPTRRKIFDTFNTAIEALSQEAFVLARSKDNFDTWALVASKYVDWTVMRNGMEGVWTWEETLEEGDMETPEFMMEIVEGDPSGKSDFCLLRLR